MATHLPSQRHPQSYPPPRRKTPHKNNQKGNKNRSPSSKFQQKCNKTQHLDLGAPRVRSGFSGRPPGRTGHPCAPCTLCGAQKLPNGGKRQAPYGDKPRLGRPSSPLELRYAALSISAASERHRRENVRLLITNM
jgi:hypothetical protein